MNKISKVLYISGGIALSIVGTLGFISSVYIYQNPFLEADKEITKATAIKQCASVLREQGFQAKASSSKGMIEIKHGTLDRWETAMAKISYSVQACEGMEMIDFCMGELCYDSKKMPVSGIVSNLKYKKPVKK